MEKEVSSQPFSEESLKRNIENIKYKILILSGKGGVGKSTLAFNLAVALSNNGKKVGLLDIDIHGPTVPKLVGWRKGEQIEANQEGKLAPLQVKENLKAMSIGFFLPVEDSAVIWRGPMKYKAIKEFLEYVDWGELDYLLIDSPPGTGDEPLSIAQLLGKLDGAIIVTLPQDVSLSAVRKSIDFCRKLEVPILGVIENMSGFICPYCGGKVDIFGKGGGEKMAKELGVQFWGRVPLEPQIVEASDAGKSLLEVDIPSEIKKIFYEFSEKLLELERK